VVKTEKLDKPKKVKYIITKGFKVGQIVEFDSKGRKIKAAINYFYTNPNSGKSFADTIYMV
jgi:hypothetical protein